MGCKSCGKTVSAQCRTGYCRPCYTRKINSDPEIIAKRKAATERLWADPMHRAKMAAIARQMGINARKDPKYRQWLTEHGKRLCREVLSRPDVAHKANCSETKLRARDKRRATQIAWCPEEYRDQFFYLLRTKRIPYAEARRMVEEQRKADLANLSPFERQMRALQNGAQLVANDQKPSLANPGIYEERRAG